MATKPQLELFYFPIRGRGDIVRSILIDAGIEFKETRIPKDDKWVARKADFVFGQMPVLKVNGSVELAQSHAIARYACSLADPRLLGGDDPLEAALVEMWYHQSEDVYKPAISSFYMKPIDEVLQLFNDSWAKWMAPFEKALSNDKTEYLANNRLSLADYHFFDVIELCNAFKPELLDTTPAVKAHWQRLCQRPGIVKFKEYVKGMPFTNSGKL